MRLLKFMVVLSSCLVAFPVFAQKNFLKPVVKSALHGPEYVCARPVQTSFEQTLRASGLSYMVPNSRVGGEALSKGVSSKVGVVKPSLANSLKCKAYEFCARHFNPAKLDEWVERNLVQEPFPAYYTSFPRAWEEFREKAGGKLGTLEVILEAAYGEDALFTGKFLQTYSEVVRFSKELETAGEPAGDALAKAYSQGMKQGIGFFALRVQAAADHPQDVLLLDIKDVKHVHWISMRQSVGGEWMDTYWLKGN